MAQDSMKGYYFQTDARQYAQSIIVDMIYYRYNTNQTIIVRI